MDIKLRRVDYLMNAMFGEEVKLISHWGPEQMCVFYLEYQYLPGNGIIKIDCERGFTNVVYHDNEGNAYYPRDYFPEYNHVMWEDHDEDLIDIVTSVKRMLDLIYKK